MEAVKQITQEQLSTIVTQQKELNSLLTNIGILESQKHSLLHQLGEVNKVIEDYKVELQEEYGAININLEDGSYTMMETEVEEQASVE
jgi:hypothetical protein